MFRFASTTCQCTYSSQIQKLLPSYPVLPTSPSLIQISDLPKHFFKVCWAAARHNMLTLLHAVQLSYSLCSHCSAAAQQAAARVSRYMHTVVAQLKLKELHRKMSLTCNIDTITKILTRITSSCVQKICNFETTVIGICFVMNRINF
jgi:hypothetical protein